MKYPLFIISVISWMPLMLTAQDTIFLANNRKPVIGKIVSVKHGRVKFFLPEKKNARLITVRFIDSVKYADGRLDESIETYRVKALTMQKKLEQRKMDARDNHRSYWARKKEKNAFIDPYPNGVSTGVQVITTSLLVARILDRHADISAALGANITLERNLLKNRLSLSASGFKSWNKTAEGFMVAARYNLLNRPKLQMGIGPAYTYAYMYYRHREYTSYAWEQDAPQFATKNYINYDAHASIFAANFHLQNRLKNRFFISQDLFLGGINYFNTSFDKAFISYRLNFGWRF